MDEAIRGAVIVLEQGRLSKFEYEGAVCAGLRAGLCLAGYRWGDADAFAIAATRAALHELGAVRPTWQQGQPDYVQYGALIRLLDTCERCGGPIEQGSLRPKRFCSDVCRVAAYSAKIWHINKRDRAAQRRAYWLAAKQHMPEQPCADCGRPFHPSPAGLNRGQTIYCGVICRNRAINKARKAAGRPWVKLHTKAQAAT